MNIAKKWVLATVLAGAMIGGVAGGALFNTSVGAAASGTQMTSSSTSTPSPANAPPSGKFVPNENASHEAGESAQREAQENAGQFPTVP